MKNPVVLSAVLVVLVAAPARAWDPWGDITNPGRIIDNVNREGKKAIEDIPNLPNNVRREVENVGREIDRMRLEFQAVTTAPLLAAWLQESRNTARSGAGTIPPHIRQALGNFYSPDIYDIVRFKVSDSGVLNLANAAISFGDAGAVTLIDTVVFADANGANNPVLWAHELKHVQQFRDWGLNDFAIRYLRSYNGVEGEAYDAERSFAGSYASTSPQPFPTTTGNNMPLPPPPPPLPPQRSAQACYTNFGFCPMAMNVPIGASCYCPSAFGPVWGVAN